IGLSQTKSSALSLRLQRRASFVSNVEFRRSLVSFLSRYGRIRYSAGSLIEIDRMAQGLLVRGNRGDADLTLIIAFWSILDALTKSLGRECVVSPLQLDVVDPA